MALKRNQILALSIPIVILFVAVSLVAIYQTPEMAEPEKKGTDYSITIRESAGVDDDI